MFPQVRSCHAYSSVSKCSFNTNYKPGTVCSGPWGKKAVDETAKVPTLLDLPFAQGRKKAKTS